MTTAAGSAPNGGTLFTLTIACGANERVAANVCVACATGTVRAAGDDPAGADTMCAAPTVDASAPAVDSGAAAVPEEASSSDDGGCSIARSRSRGVSFDLRVDRESARTREAAPPLTHA